MIGWYPSFPQRHYCSLAGSRLKFAMLDEQLPDGSQGGM
jgi:hypothetical protein